MSKTMMSHQQYYMLTIFVGIYLSIFSAFVSAFSEEIKVNRHPCGNGGIVEIECCKNTSYKGMLEIRDQDSKHVGSTDFGNNTSTWNSSYFLAVKNPRCAVLSFFMTGEGQYTCQMSASLSVYIDASSCKFCGTVDQKRLVNTVPDKGLVCESAGWEKICVIFTLLLVREFL